MKIDIHIETRFNQGDTIYWLGLNELSNQYKVRSGNVKNIVLKCYPNKEPVVGYDTTYGRFVYDFNAFKSEAELKEHYKDNETVINIGYAN